MHIYKRLLALVLSLALCLLWGCSLPKKTHSISTNPTADLPEPSTEPSTEPATEPSTEPTPETPSLYIPGVSVEDVIVYFNEVCLDAEYSNNGNPSLLQKWTEPIRYQINGDYTDEDLETLRNFTEWLNTIEGFPGIYESTDQSFNLQIFFCTADELLSRMGDDYLNCDGAVLFWYNNNNEIYDETICYSTEIDQYVRNSVIIEEIYNGLGPVQDTDLREDSMIFSGYSTPQALTEVDELILRLLYHPLMTCGMDRNQCEEVIRQLYPSNV